MGRAATRNKNLPKGMRARHRKSGVHYYLDTGALPRKEIPLGKDYVQAVIKWGELTSADSLAGSLITFRYAAEGYQRDVLPAKGVATRELNLRELANLYRFFDDPPVTIETIDPIHVRQYMTWRAASTLKAAKAANVVRAQKGRNPVKITGKEGQVVANREKALFSHIWNYAREKGMTNKANPCAGVKGFKESGRDIYVEDSILDLVYRAAEQPLVDALELAYLTGQRPADVLKLSRADIKDGALWLRQNKTKGKLRISIEGPLSTLIDRINSRKVTSLNLISNMAGAPLSRYELRGAFDRARDAAVLASPELEEEIRQFQFRDLRAKAGTDKEESGGMNAAQAQLGHSTPMMTAQYVRHRRGKLVKPTK